MDVDGRGDEFIVRAHLRLEDDEIHIETNSEERMDEMLEIVQGKLKAAQLVRDERTPVDTAKYLKEAKAAAGTAGPPSLGLPPPEDPGLKTMMQQVRSRYEERWCDEAVPALGGAPRGRRRPTRPGARRWSD